MKLVLKNKQEIEIAGMNNSFSFEKFKDGKGNELQQPYHHVCGRK